MRDEQKEDQGREIPKAAAVLVAVLAVTLVLMIMLAVPASALTASSMSLDKAKYTAAPGDVVVIKISDIPGIADDVNNSTYQITSVAFVDSDGFTAASYFTAKITYDDKNATLKVTVDEETTEGTYTMTVTPTDNATQAETAEIVVKLGATSIIVSNILYLALGIGLPIFGYILTAMVTGKKGKKVVDKLAMVCYIVGAIILIYALYLIGMGLL